VLSFLNHTGNRERIKDAQTLTSAADPACREWNAKKTRTAAGKHRFTSAGCESDRGGDGADCPLHTAIEFRSSVRSIGGGIVIALGAVVDFQGATTFRRNNLEPPPPLFNPSRPNTTEPTHRQNTAFTAEFDEGSLTLDTQQRDAIARDGVLSCEGLLPTSAFAPARAAVYAGLQRAGA
jgi:hypothetical protein